MTVALAVVTESPLDLATHIDAVSGPATGGIATFMGTVRDHDPWVDGEVVGLEYSCHPDAAAALERIARSVDTTFGTVTIAVSHRMGTLAVGESAIVVAVGAAHRAQAFDACRTLVDTIKAELPIWKRENLADGTHTWVGL